jgi:putative protease
MATKRTKKTKAAKKTRKAIKRVKRKAVKKGKTKATRAKRVLRRSSGQAPKMKAHKAVKKVAKKAKKPLQIGKVTHYYDRIGVGIIELKAPLSVGDHVTFRRGNHEFSQKVSSIQIDHAQVPKAKRGDVIGVKVKKEVKDGAVVLAG